MSACTRCGTKLTPFDAGCPRCDGSIVASPRSPTVAVHEAPPVAIDLTAATTETSATITVPSDVVRTSSAPLIPAPSGPVVGVADSQSGMPPRINVNPLDEDPLLAAIPKQDGDRILGGARLVKRLGQGGMGAVYLAQHVTLDIPVAVKLLGAHLMSDPSYAERFEREAKVSARIDHPNVVRTINFGREHGIWFLQMEFVDGCSAADLLRTKGRLSEMRALEIGLDVARALGDAHKRGIVHRDVKPDNIIVRREDGRAKLADLGLARIASGTSTAPAITGAGTTLGTPAYMAPEQIEDASHAGPAADVYSVGATLYELLCGKPPFTAASITSLFREILTLPVPDPRIHRPELSPSVRELLLRTLEKKAADRIQTADELAQLIERTLASATKDTPPPLAAAPPSASRTATSTGPKKVEDASTVPPAPPAPPRSRVVMGALAAAVIAAVGIGGWALGRSAPSPPGERTYHLGLLPETRLTTSKLQAMEPVLEALKHHVKREWKLHVGAKYEDSLQDFVDGKVDLAQFGGVSYVLATQQVPDCEILFQRSSDQRFETVFLVRSDDLSVQKLADLRGKSVAFVDPLSTSGYVIPLIELLNAGLDPKKDVEVKFLHGHDDAIDAVIRNEAVACAVDASVYHRLAAHKRFDHAKLRTLHVSEPFPDDVWVASPRLDPKLRKRVRETFLNLDPVRSEDRLVLQALNADEGRFVTASDSDYTAIRAKVRLLQDKGLLATAKR